ncbi:MAG: polysaccharide biosynthesis/export family protein [bacterium]
MVNLLYYDKLYVAGLTTEQIKLKLILHLRKYLSDELLGLIVQADSGEWKIVDAAKSMNVVVAIAATRSQFYSLQGEIQSPGRFHIDGKLTLIDAITQAGGLKCNPDVARIVLIRPSYGNNKTQKWEVNWKEIFIEGKTKLNLQVFPGDRLIVENKEVAAL